MTNTRTGAVTQYQNYDFNSFAKFSQHRYLAASEAGLYELDGTTDAGTNVISTIQGGIVQFGGSRFSGFKAAYLGVRGAGQWYLKLDAGDGTTHTYLVTAQSMQTTPAAHLPIVFGARATSPGH